MRHLHDESYQLVRRPAHRPPQLPGSRVAKRESTMPLRAKVERLPHRRQSQLGD
jgi:hypothetical protein